MRSEKFWSWISIILFITFITTFTIATKGIFLALIAVGFIPVYLVFCIGEYVIEYPDESAEGYIKPKYNIIWIISKRIDK